MPTPYKEDDANGAEFASILSYNDYSLQKMDDFRKKMETEYSEKKLSEELIQLLCNEDKGKAVIIQALLSDKTISKRYSDAVIATALNRIQLVPKTKIINKQPEGGFTGFYKKGLQTGTVVVFQGDPSITATVASDKQLLFEGRIYYMSPLAVELYKRMGKHTTSADGPRYFLYQGIPVLNLPDIDE